MRARVRSLTGVNTDAPIAPIPAVHPGSRRSALVSWDHLNIPLLLRFLGCPSSNELCTDRFSKHEFDAYFKVTMGCSDGKVQRVEKLFEGCTATLSGGAVTGRDTDGDDDSAIAGGEDEDDDERHKNTPSVATTAPPTPYPVILLDYNTSDPSNTN